jgi:hypothetical protein
MGGQASKCSKWRRSLLFFYIPWLAMRHFNPKSKEIVDAALLGFTFPLKAVWNPHR